MARSRGFGGKAKRTSGLQPLAYLGVEASQPPQLVQDKDRDPVSGTVAPDYGYNKFLIGSLWVNVDLNRIWMLTNLDAMIATWTRMGGIEDLTINGNVGQAAPDANFEIDMPGEGVLYTTGAGNVLSTDGQIIIGQTAGLPDWGNLTSLGATITVTEGANTLNIEVAAGTLGARIFDCDVGVAVVAGQTIVMAGGLNINTHGATNVVTINTDVFPVFDNVQLDDLIQGFVEIDATGKFVTSQGTDGQLIIGGTGVRAQWANLTSADGTVDITEGTNTLDVGVNETNLFATLYSPYIRRTLTPVGTITGALVVGYDDGASVYVIRGLDGVPSYKIYTAATIDGAWTLRDTDGGGGGEPAVGFMRGGGVNVFMIHTAFLDVSADATGAWTRYNVDAGHTAMTNSDIFYDGTTNWVIAGKTAAPANTAAVFVGTDPTAETFVVNTTGITEIPWHITYGNGIWVLGAENGHIFTATDPAATWTSRATPFDPARTVCVGYSPGLTLFTATAVTGADPRYPTLATSPDGITWTQVAQPEIAAGANKIIWDGTIGYIIVDPAGGGATSKCVISKDGVHWFNESNVLSSNNSGYITTDGSGMVFTGSSTAGLLSYSQIT